MKKKKKLAPAFAPPGLTFAALLANHPTNSKKDLFENVLGGGWKDLLDNPNYNNTCAVRISVMLNRLGGVYNITKEAGTADGGHKDKDGKHILIRVSAAAEFLKKVFGELSWEHIKQAGTDMDTNLIPKENGILLYHANFSNATGHIDLWKIDLLKKGSCNYKCDAADMKLAHEFWMWKFI